MKYSIKEGPSTGNRGISSTNGMQIQYSGGTHFRQPRKLSLMRKSKLIDFKALNNRLKPYLGALVCQRLLPNGQRKGDEWLALNPRRPDRHLGSFKVNLTTGVWADFATGDKGGDIISLWAYIRNIRQIEAAKELAEIVGGE
jgi:hypothetical protein